MLPQPHHNHACQVGNAKSTPILEDQTKIHIKIPRELLGILWARREHAMNTLIHKNTKILQVLWYMQRRVIMWGFVFPTRYTIWAIAAQLMTRSSHPHTPPTSHLSYCTSYLTSNISHHTSHPHTSHLTALNIQYISPVALVGHPIS